MSKTLRVLVNIAGPLEICKIFMLEKNKRIYAIMVCLIGGCKMAIEGLIFDIYVYNLTKFEFFYERCMLIILYIIAIFALLPIVRDEMTEL